MGAETIIRQKTIRYHHLDDIRVTEIITKVSLLRKSGSPRTEGMRRIAEESGCGINTIYRLARLSDVELKKWDIRKADYVTYHHEMSTDAAIYIRRRNRMASLANGSKISKCDAFIRSCLAYIRESRIHTIDEAVNTIGRNYTGKTVCTKTFYNWVNAGKIDGFARKDLPRAPGWKTRPKDWKEYTATDSRGKSILTRPETINSREEFGHWEGDLVVGPKDGINGAYITLVERMTRFYLMLPIRDKKSVTVLEALRDYKKSHPIFNQVFKSITFDNGSEFCLWREMESELGIETWFGRPYHSCDRGSNENCNGLIRRYIQKGTDINSVEAAQTRRINKEINAKRRRLLGYESAEACFSKALEKQGIPRTWMYV